MARRVRYILGVAGLALGLWGYLQLGGMLEAMIGIRPQGQERLALVILSALLGALGGFVVGPFLLREVGRCIGWLQARLLRAPAQDIVAGAIGLITGLIIAYLIRPAVPQVPIVGPYLPIAGSLLLGYLGWMVAVHKRDDFLGLLHILPRGPSRERAEEAGEAGPAKILDTSAIIDGRIADICQAGFIDGTLIIPSFVLDELRRIADSSDPLKRNRGRRGLDILNLIQKDLHVPVRIHDKDPGGEEVDMKLVKLARKMNGKIVTNDYNLNKVASLHGVRVLNVNELANAVKPVAIPGEEMVVHVIRDGKEHGQGVAYLDDGTMIVVDGGKRYIGATIGVEVTSVIQTSAGRMIFARPKPGDEARVSVFGS